MPDLPRITNVSKPVPLRKGQNVNLTCIAQSLSPVQVIWKRNDKVLVSGISQAILTLRNITAEDCGDYVSVAKNAAGEDTRTVILLGKCFHICVPDEVSQGDSSIKKTSSNNFLNFR